MGFFANVSKRRQLFSGALLVLPLFAAACSKSDSSNGDAPGDGRASSGCIQGVVVNGLTGERVKLPDASPGVGIYSLIHADMLPGQPLIAGSDANPANPSLVGEYNLCGIPVDEEFPLFVWVDGYQPFESAIAVRSTTSSRSSQAKTDLPKADPIELVNIRIYPQNQDVKDLEVDVVYNGAPLPGATVNLKPTGENFLDPSGDAFLAPKSTHQVPLKATTDAKGRAIFSAANLVLGGHYTYVVLPPDSGTKQTVAGGTLVVGLRSSGDQVAPYQVTVNLDHTEGDLVEISRSTDSDDFDKTGALRIYFNREFEIVPGTEDDIVATLSGNVTASLPDNIEGNQTYETVNFGSDSNVLTLTPAFKTKPNSDNADELNLAVIYSGIQLRPKNSPNTTHILTVTGTVRFYR